MHRLYRCHLNTYGNYISIIQVIKYDINQGYSSFLKDCSYLFKEYINE